MAFADQMRYHRARCQRQLLRLRMLTMKQDGLVVSGQLAAEIRDATNAVIAEAEAMSHVVLDAGRREPGAETFMWARITRLAVAADQAINAARSGDVRALRAQLRHFDALTSAIWTVQHAIYGQEPALGGSLPD